MQDPKLKRVVILSEAFTDGSISREELSQALEEIQHISVENTPRCIAPAAFGRPCVLPSWFN